MSVSASGPPWVRRYVLPLVVLGLLALGTWLRIDGISGSLWLDEFGTLWVVEGDLGTLFRRAIEFQGQSPFYYLSVWIPVRIWGESEIALRSVSLLSNGLFVVVLYWGGRILVGRATGLYAATIGWLSTYSIIASVQARPYALSLLAVAAAVAGFCWVIRTGRWPGRLIWILGGASVAWAHYAHYPTIVGLFAAYAVLPDLRANYPPRRFLVDGVIQGLLVALCVPQILELLARQDTLSWMDVANPWVFLGVLLPLLPLIGLGLGLRESLDDRAGVALRRSLWICLLSQVVTLELLALADINLLNIRYLAPILVPGILLAASASARLGWLEATTGFLVFALLGGGELLTKKRQFGTFSGVGHEDWLGAVNDITGRLQDASDGPVVLFRSGLVEEDTPPLGRPHPVTLSPLRSPGRAPFDWPVLSLTYRWNRSAREAYFDIAIFPALRASAHFFLLSATGSPEPESYVDQFEQWVEARWPGRFHSVRTHYGGVELLEFIERRNSR